MRELGIVTSFVLMPPTALMYIKSLKYSHTCRSRKHANRKLSKNML